MKLSEVDGQTFASIVGYDNLCLVRDINVTVSCVSKAINVDGKWYKLTGPFVVESVDALLGKISRLESELRLARLSVNEKLEADTNLNDQRRSALQTWEDELNGREISVASQQIDLKARLDLLHENMALLEQRESDLSEREVLLRLQAEVLGLDLPMASPSTYGSNLPRTTPLPASSSPSSTSSSQSATSTSTAKVYASTHPTRASSSPVSSSSSSTYSAPSSSAIPLALPPHDRAKKPLRKTTWTRAQVDAWLLKHSITDVKKPNKDGLCAIHVACRNSEDMEMVAWLLTEGGADVNAKDRRAWTALHRAVIGDRHLLVQFLIDAGADVNIAGPRGVLPLNYACVDAPESASILLENGAKVNAADEIGCMPLHIAAQNGAIEVMRILIAYGANVNAETSDHRAMTALHIAAEIGQKEAVKLLLDNGADRSARDKNDFSAHDLASRAHNKDIAELLL